jgi:hypothetical protein
VQRRRYLPLMQAASDNTLQPPDIVERVRQSIASRRSLCSEVGGLYVEHIP